MKTTEILRLVAALYVLRALEDWVLRDLKASAATASEIFGDDACEEYAARLRAE